MPRSVFYIAVTLLIVAACAATSMAQQPGLTAELHPWGRFEPGAWKLVRVVTETLDERGHVVSTNTTDTKTTLISIDAESVTLEVQTCMEVAGKSFQTEAQIIRQGFNGEIISPELKPREANESDDGEVNIEGRAIECKVQRLESAGANEKISITLYYTPNVAPYVLKRVGVVTGPENNTVHSTTTFEVIALDMPVELRGKIHGGIFVRSVRRNTKSTATTLAVILPEVPGGVLSHNFKEIDNEGRVVRRSTLNLVDYGVEPEADRAGYFHSKRAARRAAKAISRRGGRD
ncbi:MAG: hypothetical protein GX594_07070 [Pirellulaceae bacterium]|nr:hypothetical protein [Pirellulaceae bacterium]